MLTLKKVAVTGGLASGKSSVIEFFRELGAYTLNADHIVHQLLVPQTPLGKAVIRLLGTDIIENNQISRSKIAKKVFGDHTLLKSLEEIIHPAVEHEIEREYQKVKNDKAYPLFVVEVPLLFEAHADKNFDITIAVVADLSLCKQRFEGKTGQTAEEFTQRMARQQPMAEKAEHADYVITNNTSLDALRREVKQVFEEITP